RLIRSWMKLVKVASKRSASRILSVHEIDLRPDCPMTPLRRERAGPRVEPAARLMPQEWEPPRLWPNPAAVASWEYPSSAGTWSPCGAQRRGPAFSTPRLARRPKADAIYLPYPQFPANEYE